MCTNGKMPCDSNKQCMVPEAFRGLFLCNACLQAGLRKLWETRHLTVFPCFSWHFSCLMRSISATVWVDDRTSEQQLWFLISDKLTQLRDEWIHDEAVFKLLHHVHLATMCPVNLNIYWDVLMFEWAFGEQKWEVLCSNWPDRFEPSTCRACSAMGQRQWITPGAMWMVKPPLPLKIYTKLTFLGSCVVYHTIMLDDHWMMNKFAVNRVL